VWQAGNFLQSLREQLPNGNMWEFSQNASSKDAALQGTRLHWRFAHYEIHVTQVYKPFCTNRMQSVWMSWWPCLQIAWRSYLYSKERMQAGLHDGWKHHLPRRRDDGVWRLPLLVSNWTWKIRPLKGQFTFIKLLHSTSEKVHRKALPWTNTSTTFT
jgi:hypothetical protein